MSRIFLALRSAAYATAFTFLWGWLALWIRSAMGEWINLPPLSRWIGLALMMAGGILVLWCLLTFLVVGRGTPAPFDAPVHLVKTGPYRHVRNPMYEGACIVLLGFGFWNLSGTMAAFAAVFIGLAHSFVVFYEEPALELEFGAEYAEYKKRAGRWFPRTLRRTINHRRISMAKKARFVTIRTFSTEIDAQVAKAFLDSKGIRSIVTKDDVGGMNPNLQLTEGVDLLVAEKDRGKATRVLNDVDS